MTQYVIQNVVTRSDRPSGLQRAARRSSVATWPGKLGTIPRKSGLSVGQLGELANPLGGIAPQMASTACQGPLRHLPIPASSRTPASLCREHRMVNWPKTDRLQPCLPSSDGRTITGRAPGFVRPDRASSSTTVSPTAAPHRLARFFDSAPAEASSGSLSVHRTTCGGLHEVYRPRYGCYAAQTGRAWSSTCRDELTEASVLGDRPSGSRVNT
jgi:hypothetical protein